MAAHRTACGKVMKFGTQIEDHLNINHSKSLTQSAYESRGFAILNYAKNLLSNSCDLES